MLVYGDIGGSGGYVRYCKGLLGSDVIPEEVEVWFVCSKRFYEELGPLDPKVRVVSHPWPDSKSRLRRYLWHLWVYPRLVRRIKPAVEFYPAGRRRVFLRRATTVATCHNLLLFDQQELEHLEDKDSRRHLEAFREIQAESYRNCDGTIFLSEHSRQVVSQQVTGIKKTAVIPHGLDEVYVSRARSYEFGSPIRLLYVSPIFHYKHQIEVVLATKRVRETTGIDVTLRLVGGGNSASIRQLEELCATIGAQAYVTLVGAVGEDDLLEEYRSADIFIFASSCECFPNTLLEAMAAQLPIACSDRVGLPLILKDAGVYFDPEMPENISDCLSELMMDKDLRKSKGESAFRYALEYSWKRCADETFAFLKMIGGNRCR